VALHPRKLNFILAALRTWNLNKFCICPFLLLIFYIKVYWISFWLIFETDNYLLFFGFVFSRRFFYYSLFTTCLVREPLRCIRFFDIPMHNLQNRRKSIISLSSLQQKYFLIYDFSPTQFPWNTVWCKNGPFAVRPT
jgi:hypothetical protein